MPVPGRMERKQWGKSFFNLLLKTKVSSHLLCWSTGTNRNSSPLRVLKWGFLQLCLISFLNGRSEGNSVAADQSCWHCKTQLFFKVVSVVRTPSRAAIAAQPASPPGAEKLRDRCSSWRLLLSGKHFHSSGMICLLQSDRFISKLCSRVILPNCSWEMLAWHSWFWIVYSCRLRIVGMWQYFWNTYPSVLCIHEEYSCVWFLWHPHKYSALLCGQVLSLQLCQLFLVAMTPNQANGVAPFLIGVCALFLGYPLQNIGVAPCLCTRFCCVPVF